MAVRGGRVNAEDRGSGAPPRIRDHTASRRTIVPEQIVPEQIVPEQIEPEQIEPEQIVPEQIEDMRLDGRSCPRGPDHLLDGMK